MAQFPITRTARRGLSYLEVMIAAAIGLTGILGAVAMYPVASVALQKGIIADTMSAFGPSAQRQVRALELNNAQRWLFFSGLSGPGRMTEVERPSIPPNLIRPNPADNDAAAYLVRPDVGGRRWHTAISAAQSFCFDPRLISSNPAPTTNHNPLVFPSVIATQTTEMRMLRTTLVDGFSSRDRAMGTPLTPYAFPTRPMVTQQARTIFKMSDDLIFDRSEDSFGPLPAQQEALVDVNGTIQRRDYFADFEWIVTATPQMVFDNSLYAFSQPPFRNTGTYDLAIVVFYQRRSNLSEILEFTPGFDTSFVEDERVVQVDFSNGFPFGDPNRVATSGISGGDLVIAPRIGRPASDIHLQPDQWVMLSAPTRRAVPVPPPPLPNPPPGPNATVLIPGPPLFQWYRVVQTSVAADNENLRYVTLEGPDWPTAATLHPVTGAVTFEIPINPATNAPHIQMTICSGVVGVFRDTMQLQ